MNLAVHNTAKPLAARALAAIEVLFAFAATHLCFKALKQLTSLGAYERAAGLNFTPGVIMALAAVLCISARGRNWWTIGVGRVDVLQASSWYLVLAAVYALSMTVFIRLSAAEPLTAALVFFGHVASTAIGEELFFRGYIQGRLNEVFGRPWRIGRIRIGAGLFISVCLFSALHALNTVDYFHGHHVFAWGWAGVTVATGLLYGLIREKTGSVIPCIIVHGLTNVWTLSVLIIARR